MSSTFEKTPPKDWLRTKIVCTSARPDPPFAAARPPRPREPRTGAAGVLFVRARASFRRDAARRCTEADAGPGRGAGMQ